MVNLKSINRGMGGDCAVKRFYDWIKVTTSRPLGMRQQQKITPGHFLPSIEPVAHYQLPTSIACLSLTETSLSLLIIAFKYLVRQKMLQFSPTLSLNFLCGLEQNNIGKLTLPSTYLTQQCTHCLTLFIPGFFGSLVIRGGADLPPPSKNGGNGWEVPKLSCNLISYRD